MRLANKCARERMTVLYDQSAAFEGLVVGTSNKTELLLGYGTQFGDLASAINPIGDLYKTQLRQLAAPSGRAAQRFSTRSPAATCGSARPTKASWASPTPTSTGCWCCWSIAAGSRRNWCEAGFDAEFVDRVLTMIRRNQYKRRLPVIAKLTHRTMDRDFRYPRDWGT